MGSVVIQDNSGPFLKVNQDGSVNARVIGDSLVEQHTETDAVSGALTFADNISCIEIFNTSAVDGAFTVNGIAIKVPAGKTLKTLLGGTPGKTVVVAGATAYTVSSYV